MNSLGGEFFREEVSAKRFVRLQGDVLVVIPKAWRFSSAAIFAIVIVGLIGLFSMQYSRYANVTGLIKPEAGVAKLVASRSGTVTSVSGVIGQQVSKGEVLIGIRSDVDLSNGKAAGDRSISALMAQSESVGSQRSSVGASNEAQLRGFAVQAVGMQSEIQELLGQMDMQRTLVSVAATQLNEVRAVASRGFISLHELQEREIALLQRQQQLAQLRSSLASKRADLAKIQESSEEARAAGRAQGASLAALESSVVERLIAVEQSQGYVLRSPITGIVSTVDARVGEVAEQGRELLQIVPEGSRLEAEVNVPASNVGFIQVGQEVRIGVDAFPYQRYGTIRGIISSVALSAVQRPNGAGMMTFVYPVRVKLSQDWVQAIGRHERLVPGMTLSAKVIVERKNLWQWLFDPLTSLTN